MASWWTPYLAQRAKQMGLDPAAVLAVASAEGLSGAVGDQGTSFGPFQLHRGGALPTGRGRAWAESKAGLDYALRQIQGVAGGLRGQQAIANIVRRFERPADPTGEIARAASAYGNYGGKSITSAISDAVMPRQAAPRGTPGTPSRRVTESVFNPGALAQSIFSSLAGGGTPDIASLVPGAFQNVTRVIPGSPAAKAGIPVGSVPLPGGKGWFDPLHGKVIGTPGAGTHTLGNWESDRALDIAAKIGSPIYAPFAGTVGSQFGSLGAPGSSRFAGLRLHVASPQNEWYAAHLSRFAPNIRPGVRVTPGQLIGYSGSASGVGHLHEALKYGDPYRLIQ